MQGSTKSSRQHPSLKQRQVSQFRCEMAACVEDQISIEEPLEIKISTPSQPEPEVISVTMRTPGSDADLAVGFLFTEGIISGREDVDKVALEKCNGVVVHLTNDINRTDVAARHSFVASSCGVCGKKSIASVRVKRRFHCSLDAPLITPAVINGLPSALRAVQSDFNESGGTHASCLFDTSGRLLDLREDVGRHNALDKLLGAQLLRGAMPLDDKILLVSGRASFELVQKAAHAGIPILAAVGAPSSLAVELAVECNMTLLGFVRDARFNAYSGANRLQT